MILAWMLGLSPRTTRYGPESSITQDIMKHVSTDELRRKLVKSLKGEYGAPAIEDLEGGYSAGEPSAINPNLWRDAATFLLYPVASSENRTLLTLGSYKLEAMHVRVVGPGRAVVTWVAKNDTTMGSFIRGIGTPEWWNGIVGRRGPFSRISQEFYWSEEVEW